ncbi:MAG: AraC family transcriptional regulator [Fuerstiella sp.]
MAPAPSESLPTFVSRQVTEARRFFLNLNPNQNSPLEVVCGGVERMRPDYIVDRNDFPYFAIEVVAEGEGTLVIGGTEFPLAAGSVFAYGPKVPHTIRNHAENGMRKYYLDFVGTRAARLLREAELRTDANTYQKISVSALHELTELFEMLIRNSGQGGPLVGPICESLVQLLLLKIRQLRLPEGNIPSQSYATYERIRRHIDTHFLQIKSVQQLGEDCDVTPVYLSRLFKRFSDCGAYQYLLQRKMNYAAGLLMNEGLLVKEVAFRMNFTDAFQFSRAFKRVYGIPPRQLLARQQNQ